jgi:hypothetical protein
VTTTSNPTGATEAVYEWLRGAAQPILGTDAADTGSDLRKLTDRLAAATVVGIGESTRFSRQTYGRLRRSTRPDAPLGAPSPRTPAPRSTWWHHYPARPVPTRQPNSLPPWNSCARSWISTSAVWPAGAASAVATRTRRGR